MVVKLSKMVNDRRWAAQDLHSAIDRQAELLQRGFEQRCAPVLEEGESAPDLIHFLDVLGRLLEREERALEAAERKAGDYACENTRTRRERDQALREARPKFVELRRHLLLLYGTKATNDLLGFRGRTPRGALDLAIQALGIVNRLKEPELLPTARNGQRIDAGGWLAELEPPLAKLWKALDTLKDDRMQRVDVVLARQKTLKRITTTHGQVLRAIKVLYDLAGEEKLGKRLWKARRRRSRRKGRPAKREETRSGKARLRTGLRRWLTKWFK